MFNLTRKIGYLPGGNVMHTFRFHIVVMLLASILPGCGWKMAVTPIRLEGQVLDADTGVPIERAYVDISDKRDELEFAIATATLTDTDGKFDTVYQYNFEKWMWLFLPVYWIPDMPEMIFIEAYKKGYRRRITGVDSRNFKKSVDDESPPNIIEPILLHAKKKGK